MYKTTRILRYRLTSVTVNPFTSSSRLDTIPIKLSLSQFSSSSLSRQNKTSGPSQTQTPLQKDPDPNRHPVTGTKNRDESSIYSSEQTRTATTDEISNVDKKAAFDPHLTDPMKEKEVAGIEQSGGNGNPLEYSAATPEVNREKKGEGPDAGNKVGRERASGGTKRA